MGNLSKIKPNILIIVGLSLTYMSNSKLNELRQEALKKQSEKSVKDGRTALIGVRLTDEEKEALQAAAYDAGETNLSEFMRQQLANPIRRGTKILKRLKASGF